MAHNQREYDIVVLGATGYTATIVSEYITRNLATDLKWAVAGRSEKKLQILIERLKGLNGDRVPPAIEVVELEHTQLDQLMGRCCVVINGIGPYHLYSSPVIEACARNGTHYLGFSLEIPWVEEMIKKYDAIAKKTGSIIIPTIALAPSDLIVYLLAKTVSSKRFESDPGTYLEINSTAKLELQGMSAGSLNTIFSLISTYGISWLLRSRPNATTNTTTNPKNKTYNTISNTTANNSLLSKLFGYQKIPHLGHNKFPSTSLLPSLYYYDSSKNFQFHEYLPVNSFGSAVLIHFLTRFTLFILAIPWIRSLVRIMMGLEDGGSTGPDLSIARERERQVFRAVGGLRGGYGRGNGSGNENRNGNGKEKMFEAVFKWEGSVYFCSAAMGVEAARVILERGEETPAGEIGGGILTPATLGMPFVERVRGIGAFLEVGVVA